MQIQRQSAVSFNPNHSDHCIIVGVFSDQTLTPMGNTLNHQSNNALAKLISQNILPAGFSGLGGSLFIPVLPDLECSVLLIHCGDAQSISHRNYLKILHKTAVHIPDMKAKTVYCELTQLSVIDKTLDKKTEKNSHWKAFQTAYILGSKFYRFDQLKSKVKTASPVESLLIAAEASEDQALEQANVLIASLKLVKDLANLPANICNPTYLADQAKKLSEEFNTLKTEILEESDMQKLGMNSLLSVSNGSKQPAKFICFTYQGTSNKNQKPIVFVGKGITFDTGGTSIKPSAAMDEMKYDMCGGATVFGIMRIAAELKLPLNIIGLVPAVENMPGGNATRPGDIVKSLSGKTIEILNTDAEGRLILCDALTYAERFSPEIVIDMATLTGGALMTFGNIANVIMGNDQKLIDDLLDISDNCGERSWMLPLWDEYQEMLRSNFADIPNIHADNNAKTIISGCFLSQFTQNYRWAHIDIAGTAWVSGKEKGATGRPLMLMMQYLLSRA